MDSELALIGGFLAVAGAAVAGLAKPIGVLNERIYLLMPVRLQRFTRWANGGVHLDSESKIVVNRIAGTLVAVFGAALWAVAMTHNV